jgi:hypothetical protein
MAAASEGGLVTFHTKGFLVFAAFAVILTLAAEPVWGLIALVAGVVVEALLWAGLAGFGRPSREGSATHTNGSCH